MAILKDLAAEYATVCADLKGAEAVALTAEEQASVRDLEESLVAQLTAMLPKL